MRRQRWRVLVLMVLVVGGASLSLMGQESAQEEFELIVGQLSDLLDQALYLAILGFSAYDVDDHQATAQGLINLLEGPQGEHYNSSAAVTVEEGIGELLEYLLFVSWPASSVDDLGSNVYVLRDALAHGSAFLGIAHEAALEARDTREGPVGARDAFRVAYACLLAARGGLDDPFLVAGIHQLAALFPEGVPLAEEDLVQFDGTLQRLLEASLPGYEIRLGGGVYKTRVVISQSITIEGVSPEETILEGVAWDTVLMLTSASEEPIHVVLKNLTVRGGRIGVVADASVTLTLDNVVLTGNAAALGVGKGVQVDGTNVRFVENELAVSASVREDPSQLSLSDCVFEGNGSVMDIEGPVSVAVHSCEMTGGTDPSGDIALRGAATLDMRDSTLHRMAGRAIVVETSSSMVFIDNVIETAYDYAISMFSSDCGQFDRSSDLPKGAITGYGNTVSGGICPIDLRFLTDPAPGKIVVSPGESIQTAIERVGNGGFITIGEGSYRENLDIGKPVTLMGIGEVILSPFDEEIPAIRIHETGGVTVQDLRIDTAATGIEVSQANGHILDCRIDGAKEAIKVLAFGGNVVRLEHCTFTGDQSGIGVLTVGNGTIEMEACDFSGLATGAVLGGLTAVSIDSSTFEDCFDGINLASSVEAALTGDHFVGTGIRVGPAPDDSYDGPLVISANTFENCRGYAVNLCGAPGSNTLAFAGRLSGTGNVLDEMAGSLEPLCPKDYDWPQGFIAGD